MIPLGFIGEFQNCGHMESKAKQKKKLIWEQDLYEEMGLTGMREKQW